MSTRSLVTVVGGVIGWWFGYPQLGLTLGALVGSAVDPTTIQGPAINEVTVQTQAEGVPRIIPYGTVMCVGNVIQNGPLIKTTEYESQGKGGSSVETPTAYRTFAIGICEGPIKGLLRVWEDNKLVYDVRPGSLMLAESVKWMENKYLHLGDEDQFPNIFLVQIDPETPAYRGTAYLVFVLEDVTERGGSFPQYRFEVAREATEIPLERIGSEEYNLASTGGGLGPGASWVNTAAGVTGARVGLIRALFSAPDSNPAVVSTLTVKVGDEIVFTRTFSVAWEFTAQVNALGEDVLLRLETKNHGDTWVGNGGTANQQVGMLYKPYEFLLNPDYVPYYGGSEAPFIIEPDDDFYGIVDDSPDGLKALSWGPDFYEVVGGAKSLSGIVADIHSRCGILSGLYDVSELDDEVSGFSIAGSYTGADAINALRTVYMFDKSDHDGKLWYPKRGKAVVKTLTLDDLTEVPDTTKREQASELPYKLNLKYQHAASGYATVKATAPGTPSPDRRTTGEVTMETAIVLDENQAAQATDKIYKVTLAEANGTTELSAPLDVAADLADADCVGLYLRGRSSRLRIEQSAFTDWTVKFTLKNDRQSAYTSNVTGIPIPPPTLPPSTIPGETDLVVVDMPARTDSEDDLGLIVGVSGALPPWYGARLQRSLDGGATYSTVQDISQASVMGVLLEDVAAGSVHYTDTTNAVKVRLYRDSQTLDQITDQQFLSEQGGFILVSEDGETLEVIQYRDAAVEDDGSITLTTLHRGLLNSGASAHEEGAKFVLLATASHVTASASWIGINLTHRAITLGESADDTFNEQTLTYAGNSQKEWPIDQLAVFRDTGDVLAGAWVPRHRFGSDANPVASINFQGYRVTLDDGITAVSFDRLTPDFTYDASAMSSPVLVSVSSLNRITGPGPSMSQSV